MKKLNELNKKELNKKELKLTKDMIKSYESFLNMKDKKGKEALCSLVIGMFMPAYITARFTLARIEAGTLKISTYKKAAEGVRSK